MIEVETLDRCPQCGAKEFRDRWEAYDRVYRATAERFLYARCRRCGVYFLRLRPTAATVGELYGDDYSPYVCGDGPAIEAFPAGRLDRALGRGQAAWREMVAKTYALPADGGRLLDFGCGSARFLRLAEERGWDVTGADFSSAVVDRVRAEGFSCSTVDDLWDSPTHVRFDVVRMNHVLEHLYEPGSTLRLLLARMTTGGRLHAAVPNPTGVSARVFGTYWRGLEPRHLLLYPPVYLRRMLLHAGFRQVDVRHEAARRDWVGSLGYAVEGQPFLSGAASHLVARRLLSLAASVAALGGAGDRLHAVAAR